MLSTAYKEKRRSLPGSTTERLRRGQALSRGGAYVFITGRRQKKLDGAAKAIGTKLPASRETSPSWLALIGSTKPSMRKGGKWHRLGSISLRFWQCRAAIAAFECCNPPL